MQDKLRVLGIYLEKIRTGAQMLDPLSMRSQSREVLNDLAKMGLDVLNEINEQATQNPTLTAATNATAEAAAPAPPGPPVLMLHKLEVWEFKPDPYGNKLINKVRQVDGFIEGVDAFELTLDRLELTMHIHHKINELYLIGVKGVDFRAINAHFIKLWEKSMQSAGLVVDAVNRERIQDFLFQVGAKIRQHAQTTVDGVDIFQTQEATV